MASFRSIARRAVRAVTGRDPAARDIALVAASDLFVRAWYLARYPDIRAAGGDPVAHYVRSGGFEERDPGPDFSSRAYLALHPDVARSGVNPLVHYLRSGRAEGREIRPSEGGSSIESDVALVAASGLFDRAWYLATYADVAAAGTDPVEHYVKHGFSEGRNPGPNFSTSWYLAEHRDVARDGINPLVHFLRNGRAENRTTASAAVSHAGKTRTTGDAALVAASEFFNRNWYLAQYPDVADAENDPAEHYTSQGYKEGRDPGPRFSTNWYLTTYRDVAQLQINPLVHYLRAGQAEGRASGPDMGHLAGTKFVAPAFATTASDLTVLAASDWFDRAWYLTQYPEVAETGLEPAAHYLEHGAAEGKDPGPRFSTRWYLSEHADVAASGGNPLVHYLRNGQAEGREIAPSPRAIGITPGAAEPPASFPFHRPSVPAEILWQRDLEALDEAIRIGGTEVGRAGDDRLQAVLGTLCRLAGLAGGPDFDSCELRAEVDPIPAALGDIWFTTGFDLRIRLRRRQGFGVVRAYQVRLEPRGLALVGEALTGETDISFADARLIDPFSPVLVTFSGTGGDLRSAEILPFPSLCRGGLHYGETCVGGSDYLTRLRSLWSWAAQRVLDLRKSHDGAAIGRLLVDLTHATGAEAIFQPAIRTWLTGFMGIGLGSTNAPDSPEAATYFRTAPVVRDVPADGGRATPGILILPADSIPTVGALLARRSERPASARQLVPYVIADNARLVPRWMVELPPDPDLLDGQPGRPTGYPFLTLTENETRATARDDDRSLPFAIRFRDLAPAAEASLIRPAGERCMPSSLAQTPGTPSRRDASISVIIPANALEPASLAALLETLSWQTCCDRIDVTLVGGPAQGREEMRAALARSFPRRHFIIGDQAGPHQSQGINRAAARSDSRFLMVTDGSAMLHDPRTLEVLRTLADGSGIASAGCVTIAEVTLPKARHLEFLAGGIFCSLGAETDGAVEAVLSQPDIHAIFPFDTYPVAGNSARLMMVRSDNWRRVGGFDSQAFPGAGADMDYGIRAMLAGFGHLCSSAVTTVVQTDRAAPNAALPTMRKTITPGEASAIRRRAGAITDLHG